MPPSKSNDELENPQSSEETRKDWSDYELVVTREFSAPRALVFKTWIDPMHLSKWWGPHGFTNPVCNIDPRPGGKIHIVMRGPDGIDYPMGGEYVEVNEPERLTFTAGALDQDGNMMFELLKKAVFTETGEGAARKTTITVTTRFIRCTGDVSQYLSGHKEGFTQSLEKLDEYLASVAKS